VAFRQSPSLPLLWGTRRLSRKFWHAMSATGIALSPLAPYVGLHYLAGSAAAYTLEQAEEAQNGRHYTIYAAASAPTRLTQSLNFGISNRRTEGRIFVTNRDGHVVRLRRRMRARLCGATAIRMAPRGFHRTHAYASRRRTRVDRTLRWRQPLHPPGHRRRSRPPKLPIYCPRVSDPIMERSLIEKISQSRIALQAL
jgi:hypothetical protein